MSDTFDHEGDAWESLMYDDSPTYWKMNKPRCKYCGSKDVIWVIKDKGWRLFNTGTKGELHTCDEYRATKL